MTRVFCVCSCAPVRVRNLVEFFGPIESWLIEGDNADQLETYQLQDGILQEQPLGLLTTAEVSAL